MTWRSSLCSIRLTCRVRTGAHLRRGAGRQWSVFGTSQGEDGLRRVLWDMDRGQLGSGHRRREPPRPPMDAKGRVSLRQELPCGQPCKGRHTEKKHQQSRRAQQGPAGPSRAQQGPAASASRCTATPAGPTPAPLQIPAPCARHATLSGRQPKTYIPPCSTHLRTVHAMPCSLRRGC